MPPDENLSQLAARQVRAVLHRWDPEPLPDRAGHPAALDDLVAPILAALTFVPSVPELASELEALVFTRLRVRASWGECLAAARDLLDGHRSLSVSVIDAG